MKHLRLILLLVGVLSVSMGWSQSCDHTSALGPDAGHSQLGLLVGDYPLHGKAQLKKKVDGMGQESMSNWFQVNILRLHLGQEISPAPVTGEEAGADVLGRLEYEQALLALLKGEYSKAVQKFNASELNTSLGRACRLNNYRLVAQYLDKYGDKAPLFPHFNGGFFQFCEDSLRWGTEQTDSVAYHQMLTTVSDLIVLSQEKTVYFELIADLLGRHSDQVTANWFGAVAYLRLADDIPKQKTLIEEKAFHALEAPKTSKGRFDNYQFTQLKKHFANDRSAAKEAREAYLKTESSDPAKASQEAVARFGKPQPGLIWLNQEDNSNIAIVMRKAFAKYAEELGRKARFGEGEVDLKAVKSDTQFNLYALLMVGTVIFAVVFIGYKVRQNRRNM